MNNKHCVMFVDALKILTREDHHLDDEIIVRMREYHPAPPG